MKGKSVLIIAALGAGAWYLMQQKKALDILNYYIASVGLTFDGVQPILTLHIGVQNVSNASFTINSFVGNLTANDKTLGTASSFIPILIGASSQTTFPVQIRLNLIGITSDIIAILNGQSGLQQTIKLQGYVNASGLVAPVELTYKIG
jgi:hypothetical protein